MSLVRFCRKKSSLRANYSAQLTNSIELSWVLQFNKVVMKVDKSSILMLVIEIEDK